MLRWNLLYFSLWPLFLVLSLGTSEQSLAASRGHICGYLSPPFHSNQAQLPQSLLTEMLQTPQHLCGLCCSSSTSLLLTFNNEPCPRRSTFRDPGEGRVGTPNTEDTQQRPEVMPGGAHQPWTVPPPHPHLPGVLPAIPVPGNGQFPLRAGPCVSQLPPPLSAKTTPLPAEKSTNPNHISLLCSQYHTQSPQIWQCPDCPAPCAHPS